MLADADIKKYGAELFDAMVARAVVSPLMKRVTDITTEDAYQISLDFLRRRQVASEEKLVGKKIGITSDAVQSMLGVSEPDF